MYQELDDMTILISPYNPPESQTQHQQTSQPNAIKLEHSLLTPSKHLSPPNSTNPTPQPTPISPQITHQRLLQRALRHARPAEIAETAAHAGSAFAAKGLG
jgi:hypothetical protein